MSDGVMSAKLKILDQVIDCGGAHPIEDVIGHTDEMAWVIDGVTTLTPERLTDATSDGKWLADIFAEQLRVGAAEDSLQDIMRAGIHQAAVLSRDWPIIPVTPPSATVGIVRLKPSSVEYFVLGDVSVIFLGDETRAISDTSSEKKSPHLEVRWQEAKDLLRRTSRDSPLYDAVKAHVNSLLVEHKQRSMNQPGGYWISSLDERAPSHALTGEVKGADRILLCSDGFARLVDHFSTFSSWEDLVASGKTLRECVDILRETENSDKECTRFPRISASDDAAALLIEMQRSGLVPTKQTKRGR